MRKYLMEEKIKNLGDRVKDLENRIVQYSSSSFLNEAFLALF